ncbi:cytochrome P450 family protein [Pseudonocardia spinosispora]|uniref:cytochrome P450 family protein n=1 Tax=Pseudonocardia spinosispora TaxID=103441 RepID=UPI0004009AD5|nr:cytochrome P450 [Pseudonocardia spinosispora]
MTGSAVHDADQVIRLDKTFMADPHAVYELLRRERPVARARSEQGLPVWLITRYDDVRAALVDPRLAKDSAGLGAVFDRVVPPDKRMPFGPELTAHMLNSDPPQHTRLRALVNRGFTGRSIALMRPRIEAIAAELAEALAARLAAGEEVDLLDEFAFPLPMTVISEILGVPGEHRDEFRGWSNHALSSAPIEERAPSLMAMAEFLTRLVADKRARPGEDMLSAAVAASEDTDHLSDNEAVAMAFLLLVAGHETTVNLISNGMLALLRNPDQLVQLRADPSLLPGAVEEFLRFDGPLNLATMRFTAEPVTIAGTDIPQGELVLVSLASANRDPDHFERPDELDLRRGGTNLAFGHGIHHCLGAALARLEGQIAFRALLDQVPPFELAGNPEDLIWRDSTLIRGVKRLHIRRA